MQDLLIVFLCWSTVAQSMASEIDHTRYNEGKRQFELMQQQSELPRYGQCWVRAMTFIQYGCKRLTDETQARLSLAYLNCFLQLQGRPSYMCSEDEEIHTCIKDMSDVDRGSLTTFFTHTQNICYFLQAQVWHENTEHTISRLSDSSTKVAEQLENSNELQKDLLSSQSQSLENQAILMNQTVSLNNIINTSSETVQVLFEDLKKSTQEQREVMGDLFDKLSKLQSTILGEVSGFYSLFYYVLSVIICYLLTSTPRTADARIWLFLIMTISVIVEQTLVPWLSGMVTIFTVEPEGNEHIYYLQKVCRRVFIVLALLILGVCVFMYRDINALNNQLLLEIRKQNSDIRRSLSGYLPAPESLNVDQSHATTFSDSDYTSGDSDGDSSDSDKTFILPENADTSDVESYTTMHDDAESDINKTSLLCELYDLRKATPMREVNSKVDSWLQKSSLDGSQFVSPAASPSHGVSHYNLRPRKAQASPNISPATKVESSKSFSRTVRQMQEITEKNSRLLRAYYQQNNESEPLPPQGNKIETNPQPLSLVLKNEGDVKLNISKEMRTDDLERSSIVTRSSRGSVRGHLE